MPTNCEWKARPDWNWNNQMTKIIPTLSYSLPCPQQSASTVYPRRYRFLLIYKIFTPITAVFKSKPALPIHTRRIQFCCGWSSSITAISFSRSSTGLTEINCSNFFAWAESVAPLNINAVREIELPQLISVNTVNDLESRMQNEIVVIELDQPQKNWIRRVNRKCRIWFEKYWRENPVIQIFSCTVCLSSVQIFMGLYD